MALPQLGTLGHWYSAVQQTSALPTIDDVSGNGNDGTQTGGVARVQAADGSWWFDFSAAANAEITAGENTPVGVAFTYLLRPARRVGATWPPDAVIFFASPGASVNLPGLYYDPAQGATGVIRALLDNAGFNTSEDIESWTAEDPHILAMTHDGVANGTLRVYRDDWNTPILEQSGIDPGAVSAAITWGTYNSGQSWRNLMSDMAFWRGTQLSSSELTQAAAEFEAVNSSGVTLTADSGSFALTGQDADLIASRLLTADAGSLSLTGQDAALNAGRIISADVGEFALSGQDASLLAARTLSAETGSFSAPGPDTALTVDRIIGAESGSFALTGQDVGLEIESPGAYSLTADAGAFTLAGQDTGLISDRLLTADTGEFDLTGVPADLTVERRLSAEPGTFNVSGFTAGLVAARLLSAESAALVLTGIDADLRVPRIQAEAGSFALTGHDVVFTLVSAGGDPIALISAAETGLQLTSDEEDEESGLTLTAARVNKHWLFWDSDNVELTRKEERVSSVIVPEVIVSHYGVANSLSSLVGAQRATGYWAHLTIDGWAGGTHGAAYRVYQSMQFNMRGSHAGKSSWTNPATGLQWSSEKGTGVNACSIGIEIANPGPLIRCKDGALRTDANAKKFFAGKSTPVWEEDQAIEALHKDGRRIMPYGEWTHWAIYTDQEIDILIGVCHALRKAYPTLVDLVGHDDISPGRKSDPGPAFPTSWLREKIFA